MCVYPLRQKGLCWRVFYEGRPLWVVRLQAAHFWFSFPQFEMKSCNGFIHSLLTFSPPCNKMNCKEKRHNHFPQEAWGVTASLPIPNKKEVSELSKSLRMIESPCSQFQQAPTFASVGICIKPWIKGLLFKHSVQLEGLVPGWSVSGTAILQDGGVLATVILQPSLHSLPC